MEQIYANSDFALANASTSDKRSQYKAQKTLEKKVPGHKWAKVSMIALTVCLVLALGVVCTLAVFLARAKNSDFNASESENDHNAMESDFNASESKNDPNAMDYKEQLYELRNQHLEVLRKLNRFNQSSGCALCGVHWIPSGGKCYYFSTFKLNWTQSRDHCVTLGGHLAIITSQAEQDFLNSNVKETLWIGLTDADTEGQWFWVNNQPLGNTVEFWMKRENGNDEPDNWTKEDPGGEDCGSLGHKNGQTDLWTDAYCFEMKRFVCQAPAAV